MPMLAELVDAVVGIDTRRDTHQVEIALPRRRPDRPHAIGNDSTGYAELLHALIVDHAPGPGWPCRSRAPTATASGWPAPPPRPPRPLSSANSPTVSPTRERYVPTRSTRTWPCWPRCAWTPTGCPSAQPTGTARRCGSCSARRGELTTASTAQTNRLRALLLGGDDTDRTLARGTLTETRLAGLARRRPPREASREQAVRHAEIRRLALALREAARALKANRVALQAVVNDVVPGLIERRGIGPVSAAQAIVSFSHPGRCRNDAAFAALAGASPLEASSGRTVRHRLNRGGDRALNRALHTIAVTRMRSCPTTQAYVARRTADGKNPREIRRCLKRYIARQLTAP